MKLKLVYDPNRPYSSYVCNAATGEIIENVSGIDFHLNQSSHMGELHITVLKPEIEAIPTNSPEPTEPVSKAWPY